MVLPTSRPPQRPCNKPEPVAQPGANPTGERPAAAGEDRAEKQQGEPGRGPAVEGGGEDVMAGSVRGDRLVW
jgi:hypothetical protein